MAIARLNVAFTLVSCKFLAPLAIPPPRVRLASTGFRSTSTSFHHHSLLLLLLLLVFSTLEASGCASWTRVAYATRKTCFAVVHHDRERKREREKVTRCRGEIGVGCRRVCRVRTSKLESLQRLDWKKLSNQGVKSRQGERRMENSRRNGRKGDEKSTRALETRAYLLTELLKKRAFTQFLLARVFSTCPAIFFSSSFPRPCRWTSTNESCAQGSRLCIIGEFVLPSHFLATKTRKSE